MLHLSQKASHDCFMPKFSSISDATMDHNTARKVMSKALTLFGGASASQTRLLWAFTRQELARACNHIAHNQRTDWAELGQRFGRLLDACSQENCGCSGARRFGA